MDLLNYFKPVASMTAEDARVYMKDKNPEDYNLIDVFPLTNSKYSSPTYISAL